MRPESEEAQPGGKSRRRAGEAGDTEQASSTTNYPTETAARQRIRLLAYLREHGSLTTLEARTELGVWHPAECVHELRHQGHPIEAVMELLRSTDSHRHRIARYVLGSAGEHQGGYRS